MDLFQAAAARESRDEALRIVAENRPDWVERAVEAIRRIAREQPTITASDVWGRMDATDNPRAMGAAFVRAKALDIVEPSGLPPRSTERANARKMTVWRSLLFRPANGFEAGNRELKAGQIARWLIRAGAEADVVATLTPDQWATVGKLAGAKSAPSDATVLRVLDILRESERRAAS